VMVRTHNPEFRKASNIITVPIPRIDVWIPDKYQAVKRFFETNAYVWKNESAIQGAVDYAVFSAVKKADANQKGCAFLRKRKNPPRSSPPVLPVVSFIRPPSVANIGRYLSVSPIILASPVYGKRNNAGRQFPTRIQVHDGIQIFEGACPRMPVQQKEPS
jgi:hypothetical protein